MRSIQARLIVLLCAVTMILLVATGWLVYHFVSTDLVDQFDRSLRAEAAAIVSLVTVESNGQIDFDYNDGAMPQYERSRRAEYFVIRDGKGRIIARSRSLGSNAPPELSAGVRRANLRLPDGHAGRALRMDFVPQPDPDAKTAIKAATAVDSPFSVIVARRRGPLEEALERLLNTLVVAGAVLAGCLAVGVILVVQHTLQPLRKIRDTAVAIEPERLDLRLPVHELPTELAPICNCLNDLLERLDAAFARERRFTSDVAHELRTPIAELRSVTEVALRNLDDPVLAQEACRDADAIAQQMQTLVNTLLALVRSQRTIAIPTTSISLREAVSCTMETLPCDQGAVHAEIPENAYVSAEPALLASTMRNILFNAVEYREIDSIVSCVASLRGGQWVLVIENQCKNISNDDLSHVFEPFWRKDVSRSDSVHAGLGLALVQAYCRLMRINIHVTLRNSSIFHIELQFAPAPDRSETGSPGVATIHSS